MVSERFYKCLRCWLRVSIVFTITATNIVLGRFTEAPSDQEPVEGSSLSVSCSAEGALFLLWYKDGQIIPPDGPHYSQSSSGGGSSATLSMESVSHSIHTGEYECVSVNIDSSMDSSPFTVTVKYIDSEVGIRLAVSGSNCSSAGDLEVASGCQMRLVCDPPHGYPPNITVSWFRNDAVLRSAMGVVFLEDNEVLTIGSASFDDSGCYQCRASNGIGIIRHSPTVPVAVQEPGRGLRFSESNTDQEGAVSVTEGDPLSLNCSVEDGVGMVEFQWLLQRAGREEEELQERGRVNVSSTANTSVLVIPKTAVEDEGEYSCVVADCLTHIKRNFTVSIIVPRAIVEWPPPEVLLREGERAQFDCVATGRPQPVVIWFFQSTQVPRTPSSGLEDLGNGSLLIPVLQPRHSGTYFCMLEKTPLDIHTFSLTVESSKEQQLPSIVAPSPTVPVSSPTSTSFTHSGHFTIGPFSELISIVVVCVGGLVFLLLCSLPLCLSCYYYCCWRRRRHSKTLQAAGENNCHTIPAESYLFTSYSEREEGANGVIRPRHRRLPLPPEPEIDPGNHYEEMEEVTMDTTSGVGRPRLPTFSSETSDTAGTELETIISAATDTTIS